MSRHARFTRFLLCNVCNNGDAPIASALYVARRMFDDFVARTPHLPPHVVAQSRLD